MSLKKFNIYVVLVALTIMTLLYIYIAQLLEENIDMQVKNSVRASSLEMRQQLLNNVNTLMQRFEHYQEISLKKLEHVSGAVTDKTTDAELAALARSINTDVYDGHYEIFIIGEDKVITKSTSQGDLGLDYKAYPYFSKELDLLKSGDVAYKISAPTFDEYALDIAQNYIASAGEKRWVMVAFVLPFSEYVNYKTEELKELFPALQSLGLYILTYDNIQFINTKAEKSKDFTSDMQKKEQYATMIMEDLGLAKSPGSSEIQSIAANFAEHNVALTHEDTEHTSTVYSLVASSFENTADDFMLIAKAKFDQNAYLSEYAHLQELIYLFITLIYLFLLLGFVLMYKAVVQKISSIEKQMHADDPIVMEGFLFSEFSYFLERYNTFLLHWKEEVNRLNDITMQDELTKCANRRYFNKMMKSQIDLYDRYGKEFSMIMFDIDDFKAVNDIYGHSTGDDVLCKLTADVTSQLRTSDVLCRIGGEEFAIVLPETNLESAMFVAEKIRKRIENGRYVKDRRVTISLGADSYHPEYDFDSFYSTVDGFLYKSKHSGKNCVNSSSSLSS